MAAIDRPNRDILTQGINIIPGLHAGVHRSYSPKYQRCAIASRTSMAFSLKCKQPVLKGPITALTKWKTLTMNGRRKMNLKNKYARSNY